MRACKDIASAARKTASNAKWGGSGSGGTGSGSGGGGDDDGGIGGALGQLRRFMRRAGVGAKQAYNAVDVDGRDWRIIPFSATPSLWNPHFLS